MLLADPNHWRLARKYKLPACTSKLCGIHRLTRWRYSQTPLFVARLSGPKACSKPAHGRRAQRGALGKGSDVLSASAEGAADRSPQFCHPFGACRAIIHNPGLGAAILGRGWLVTGLRPGVTRTTTGWKPIPRKESRRRSVGLHWPTGVAVPFDRSEFRVYAVLNNAWHRFAGGAPTRCVSKGLHGQHRSGRANPPRDALSSHSVPC